MQLLGNQKPALKIKLNDRVLGSVVNRSVGCSEVPPHPAPGAQQGLLSCPPAVRWLGRHGLKWQVVMGPEAEVRSAADRPEIPWVLRETVAFQQACHLRALLRGPEGHTASVWSLASPSVPAQFTLSSPQAELLRKSLLIRWEGKARSLETDTLVPGVTNSKKHFIITLQHINSLGQICAFWQLGIIQSCPLQAPAFLHIALFAGWLWPWGPVVEGGEKAGQPHPAVQLPEGGPRLSSAWVAAGVEGPLLRGQAGKEGVQQGLRQCDALGRVEF